ncbi:Rieske (2Fe-2S) protein [Methanogenium organophilum]|uniref:Rieske (2Fe-2S) protein n=1 Tax=Methanogenium organophilum TaxID=2199 RepID=A0A9X9S2X3_METOG|nr:Rieske (2Fe-2S) protein [Methanogenium organophilum]WAI00546.1 Rieske (2Fe-2S) protein [Methanogenium organophilum]
MSEFIEVFTTTDIQDGAMKKGIIGDREILIARVGDRYYAADNRCPHMGGDLSSGTLTETVVTCPRHHSQFDLRSGTAIRWTDWSGIKLSVAKFVKSPRTLKTHEVKVEGESILVKLRE